MSDYGRTPFDQPDLAALAHTDRLLDALATRQPVDFPEFEEPGDDVLAALLADWRDDLRWPPASALVSDAEAIAALERGLADQPPNRRGLALAGSAAAAVLALGGFGALVGNAQPGDALYGMHMMLFGEPPSVHDDRVELAAKTDLEQVQQMINQGQWSQAQDKLAAVNDSVQTVNDTSRKQQLVDQMTQLNAKVATHDPNATVAPSALPDPAVPPAATTTIPVSTSASSSEPATSVPSSAAAPTTTAPAATTTASPVPAPTPTSASPAATSQTQPSPSTGAARTSAAAPSPSSAAPSPSSSAPPTANATTPTTSAPAPAQSPSQVVSVTQTTEAPSTAAKRTSQQPIPGSGGKTGGPGEN